MPVLSCFTPCGMLACSSAPSHAEKIFGALKRQYERSNISVAKGSRTDCTIYAQAMGLARGKYALEKAGRQQLAAQVSDLIDLKEHEYGMAPGPTATMSQRRGALAAAKKLPGGAARHNVANALTALLGADFKAYRTMKPSEVVANPASASDSPNAFKLPSVPAKLVKLTVDVCVGLGAPQAVSYEKVSLPSHPALATAARYLQVGDVLVIDAGMPGLEERVTVTAATQSTFTATFTLPHGIGAVCTTQPWPRWTSTQRFSLVVVSASAAVDPEKRRAVDDLMHRMARGVSTWAIVAETTAGHTGPFTIGSSPIGATTVADTLTA